MRHDHNSSLWAVPAPAGRKFLRRVTVGAVGLTIAVIAGMSVIEQVAPISTAGGCAYTWSALDSGCGRDGAATVTAAIRPIRVISVERDAPVVIAKAPDSSKPSEPPAPAAAIAPPTSDEQPARPAPTTDGSSRVATVEPARPEISMPISEEELTFKAGAQHRPRAVAPVKEDAAQRPPAAPRKVARAKPSRTVAQTYELPDGRRITVHRGYQASREDGDDGRRLRAAEAGRRYDDSYGGFFGERRAQGGFGGLY